MIGPFYVGQIPANPLLITVRDNDDEIVVITNYTGATGTLIDPNGAEVALSGVTFDVDSQASSGNILMTLGSTSLFAIPGVYELHIALTGPGSVKDYLDPFLVEVKALASEVADLTEAWVTEAEVGKYTGITVTFEEIIRAQTVIEVIGDVSIEATPNLSTKNLRLLKLSVAYQAAWMTEHPDVFTNVDVLSFLQDGSQSTLAHMNAGILAPMAYRCMKRLSWKRSRSIKIRARGDNDMALLTGVGHLRDNAVADDDLPWTPFR